MPVRFDPFTKGHLDVAVQAGRMFGRVIIAIGVNPSKICMFTPEERKLLIERELTGVAWELRGGTLQGPAGALRSNEARNGAYSAEFET